MFTKLAERQSAVVEAALRDIEPGLSWRGFFVHAEFAHEDAPVQSLTEAFFVLTHPDPAKPRWVPLGESVTRALEALYFAYRDAGQGFAQVDLTVIAPDGRYRFELGLGPSLRLGGQRDPDAKPRLDRRYQQMLLELGLAAPTPEPAPATRAPAQPRRSHVRPATAVNLAQAVAIEVESWHRHLASADRAEAEGRPQIARLFRAAARSEEIQARFHCGLMGAEPPAASTPEAARVGTTLENVTAALEADTSKQTDLYARMKMEAAKEESTKVQDVFFMAKRAAEARACLFSAALDRLTAGADMREIDAFFACSLCGALDFFAPPDGCYGCGTSAARFVSVS